MSRSPVKLEITIFKANVRGVQRKVTFAQKLAPRMGYMADVRLLLLVVIR